MNSVFMKTLRDKRWFMLGWFIGFAFLAMLLVVFYPSMRQEGAMDQLMTTMPEALKGMMGNLADLTRFDTYLASQLFDIRASLLAGVMAIVLALGLSANEEEKGQMRTLLALPIGRTSLLLQKWLAMAVILFVTLSGIAITVLALQATVDANIGIDVLMRLFFMTWLVMLAIATVTFAMAMATGKRAFAMLVGIVVMAGSFIVSTFGMSVDWLANGEWLSLFHYFPAAEVARSGIELKNVAVLSGIILVMLIAAYLLFRKRDVN